MYLYNAAFVTSRIYGNYLPVESIRITLSNQPGNLENNMEISLYGLKSKNNSTKIHC